MQRRDIFFWFRLSMSCKDKTDKLRKVYFSHLQIVRETFFFDSFTSLFYNFFRHKISKCILLCISFTWMSWFKFIWRQLLLLAYIYQKNFWRDTCDIFMPILYFSYISHAEWSDRFPKFEIIEIKYHLVRFN